MKVILESLGSIADATMGELKDRVGAVFHCPVETRPGLSDLTPAYDGQRRQYFSSELLTSLQRADRDERVVGVTDVDLYVPRLNYVFGEADMESGRAIISLYRLRQEHYGLPADEALLLERATKEIVHELGHTFGLGHCADSKCIMHFSNSLADTDVKEAGFCGHCRPKIII